MRSRNQTNAQSTQSKNPAAKATTNQSRKSNVPSTPRRSVRIAQRQASTPDKADPMEVDNEFFQGLFRFGSMNVRSFQWLDRDQQKDRQPEETEETEETEKDVSGHKIGTNDSDNTGNEPEANDTGKGNNDDQSMLFFSHGC